MNHGPTRRHGIGRAARGARENETICLNHRDHAVSAIKFEFGQIRRVSSVDDNFVQNTVSCVIIVIIFGLCEFFE